MYRGLLQRILNWTLQRDEWFSWSHEACIWLEVWLHETTKAFCYICGDVGKYLHISGVVKGFVDWWSEKEWEEMWFLWVKKWSQESWVLWHGHVWRGRGTCSRGNQQLKAHHFWIFHFNKCATPDMLLVYLLVWGENVLKFILRDSIK